MLTLALLVYNVWGQVVILCWHWHCWFTMSGADRHTMLTLILLVYNVWGQVGILCWHWHCSFTMFGADIHTMLTLILLVYNVWGRQIYNADIEIVGLQCLGQIDILCWHWYCWFTTSWADRHTMLTLTLLVYNVWGR